MSEKVQEKYKYVLYEKWGRVAIVTINRPEVMNAINPPALAELNAVWSDFIADDEAWVAILTGAGERAFSTGADMKYFAEKEHQQDLLRPEKHVKHVLDDCHKPVIAAVNGYAVGGGLEMAMRCDIIIAAEHARLGLPEPRRGLLADTGGVLKLPMRIPYHLAMGLILTGKLITAQEGYRIGLVNEVVPLGDLMETARRWALEILECAPLSVQAAKQVVVESMRSAFGADAVQIEKLEAVQRLRGSEDYRDGPKAFAEKRKLVWKGR
jgi:enoyl-CoA hydratase/carnithine racemase